MSGSAKVRVRHKSKHHNFVAVKIGNIRVRALVDTTCMSLALIKRLKFDTNIMPVSQRKCLFTADGKAMYVLGTVQSTLYIQDFQIPVSAVKSLTAEHCEDRDPLVFDHTSAEPSAICCCSCRGEPCAALDNCSRPENSHRQ